MVDDSDEQATSGGIVGVLSRRRVLSAAAIVGIAGGANSLVGGQEMGEIELEGYTGGWEGVTPAEIEGQTNPTLSLEAGVDYTVTWTNEDGQPHNFVLRDADGNDIVRSDIIEEGSQTVEFTASEDMATYLCEVHPNTMVGDVETEAGTDAPEEEEPEEEEEEPEEEEEEEEEDDGDGDGQEGPTASVTFEDQSTDGSSVEVASVTTSEGGFVAIHDSRLFDGDALGSVIGVSEYLEAGTHEGVTVDLDETPDDGETLVAMPHLDTNDNQTYDFVTSEGEEDGPYTDEDGAVTDDATVTLEGDEEPDAGFPREYEATLSGEPHGVETEASGEATFEVEAHEDGMDAHYELTVENICDVTQAHIHLGAEGEDGPIVVWLYPEEGMEPELVEGLFSGTLAEGTITEDDFVGEWEGADFETARETVETGGAYVNVHTEEHPGGEIRGQIEPVNGS